MSFSHSCAVFHTVMLDLGRCYCHQGKFQKSEDFHKRALKVRRDLFGDRHRNTATGSVKFSGIKKTVTVQVNIVSL